MSNLLTALNKFNISPQAIPDLWAWYDPSDLTTVTESSGLVSQINDKSPNQFHIVQATGINQPSINTETLANKKVLDFSGNQWLENQNISGILNGFNQELTIFSLVRHTSSLGTSGYSITLSDKNEPSGINFMGVNRRQSDQHQSFGIDAIGGGIGSERIGFIGSPGEYEIQTLRLKRVGGVNIYEKRLDGKLLSSFPSSPAGDNTFANINTLTIGARNRLTTTNVAMIGQTAEVIIFNRGLSNQEIIAIEKYLDNKFGLGITAYDIVQQGLFAHYDETTIVTDTGSNVIGWNDKLGNNDLSKAGDSGTLTKLSNALNGIAGIEFGTGGFTRLVSSDKATWKFLHELDTTIFVVCKTSSSNPDNFQGILSTSKTLVTDIGMIMAIDDRSGSAVNDKILVQNVNGSALAIDADGGNDSIDLSQANIISYRHITTVSDVYVNNVKVVDTISNIATPSSSDPTDFLSIGSESTISQFEGVIVEILFYKRQRSELEVQAITQFLSNKWGIALP